MFCYHCYTLSLSNPDEGIRQFWIEHTKRCRAVAEAMGEAQGDPLSLIHI